MKEKMRGSFARTIKRVLTVALAMVLVTTTVAFSDLNVNAEGNVGDVVNSGIAGETGDVAGGEVTPPSADDLAPSDEAATPDAVDATPSADAVTPSEDAAVQENILGGEITTLFTTLFSSRPTHTYVAIVVAPTCTEDGYTYYECNICGDIQKDRWRNDIHDNKVKAVGHNYLATVIAPTCTADGYTYYKCSVCGDIQKDKHGKEIHDNIIKAGHNYLASVVAPTCTADGYTYYKCSVCGNIQKDKRGNDIHDHKVNATGHVWDTSKTVINLQTGNITRTCSICGITKTDHYNSVSASYYLLKPGVPQQEESTGIDRSHSSDFFIPVGTGSFLDAFNGYKTYIGDGEFSIASLLISKPSGTQTYTVNGKDYSINLDAVNWYVIKGDYNDKHIDGIGTWAEVTYGITYKLNNGQLDATGTYNKATGLASLPTSVEIPTLVKVGYSFGGWYSDVTLTTPVTAKPAIPVGTTGALTFYAKWNAIPYGITYNTNGGTLAEGTPVTYTIEDAVTLPDVTKVTKKGYTFKGWFTDEALTQAASNIEKGSTEAKSFYAKWEVIPYGITYNTNGGTLAAGTPVTYTVEDAVTLPEVIRTGYTFMGWFTDEALTQAASNIEKGSTEAKSFYAKWEVIVYNITYVTNNGTVPSDAVKTYTVENAVTFPQASRTGFYVFDGWYKEDTLVNASTGIAQGSTGNVTVYAKWRLAQMLTVTFVDGFGNTISTQTVASGLGATAPAAPTIEGYTFAGWDRAFDYVSTSITVTAIYTANAVINEAPVALAATPVRRVAATVTTPIAEEPVAEAATPEVTPAVENTTEEVQPEVSDATTTIQDEEAPLATLESDCWIHWAILILSGVYAVYGVLRAVVRNKKIRQLQGDTNEVNA